MPEVLFLHLLLGVDGLLDARGDRNAPIVRNILNEAKKLLLSEDVWDGGSEGRGEVAEEIVHRR